MGIHLSGIAPTPISVDQREMAEALYDFASIHNSITSGESNIYGAMGEVLFASIAEGTYEPSKDFDFVTRFGTVDVKTKRTTVPPRPDFFCSVAATSLHQRPDWFYFVRVMEDLSAGFLLGGVRREEFFDLATFKQAGELDSNGWEFKADCYNLSVGEVMAHGHTDWGES